MQPREALAVDKLQILGGGGGGGGWGGEGVIEQGEERESRTGLSLASNLYN